jgi:hypothetical protein
MAGQLAALHRRTDRTRPRLRRPVHQRRDPRVDERAHAHQARLDRHAEHGAREAIVRETPRGVADRHDLGVRRGIAGADRLVAAAPHDLALQRDDGADRHLAGIARAPRLFERRRHQLVVHVWARPPARPPPANPSNIGMYLIR